MDSLMLVCVLIYMYLITKTLRPIMHLMYSRDVAAHQKCHGLAR